MDRQHLLPLGERKLVDWVNDLDAGVAHEHIDSAELCGYRLDAAGDGLLVADIHGDAHGLPSGRDNFSRRSVCRFAVQVGDRDSGALAGEAEGNVPADAAGGAGDDG
jgi:hypothetical protein